MLELLGLFGYVCTSIMLHLAVNKWSMMAAVKSNDSSVLLLETSMLFSETTV